MLRLQLPVATGRHASRSLLLLQRHAALVLIIRGPERLLRCVLWLLLLWVLLVQRLPVLLLAWLAILLRRRLLVLLLLLLLLVRRLEVLCRLHVRGTRRNRLWHTSVCSSGRHMAWHRSRSRHRHRPTILLSSRPSSGRGATSECRTR